MTCKINEQTPYRAGEHPVYISTENRCTHIGKKHLTLQC